MEAMKRATVTFPDDLAQAVDQFRDAQETPPTLTTLMQTALREFLQERGFLRSRRRLKLGPVGRSGRSDVSRNHDDYFAGIKK
jgi:metal-responsive CopG/Arc/MetJ family transcriptional regulator